MARPTHVPKFGNWDANDHVPYTAVFESARAGKGGKLINPNDPSENPAAFGGGIVKEDIPFSRPHTEQSKNRNQPAPKNSFQPNGGEHIHAQRVHGETRYLGQPGGPPRTVLGDAPRSRPGLGENASSGHGFGESHGADRSPSHVQSYQGRLGKKPGSASPAWERKVSSEGTTMFAPATPGRSRLGTKGEETPDRGSALPKFGAWDEKDPSSAEGFTVIFNQARSEKKAGGPVRVPGFQSESPARLDYPESRKQHLSAAQRKPPSLWSCCFSSSTVE